MTGITISFSTNSANDSGILSHLLYQFPFLMLTAVAGYFRFLKASTIFEQPFVENHVYVVAAADHSALFSFSVVPFNVKVPTRLCAGYDIMQPSDRISLQTSKFSEGRCGQQLKPIQQQ